MAGEAVRATFASKGSPRALDRCADPICVFPDPKTLEMDSTRSILALESVAGFRRDGREMLRDGIRMLKFGKSQAEAAP